MTTGDDDSGSFDRGRVATRLAALAGEGIMLGTSSWKYPGWLGQLYSRGRYEYHGRFAETRFNRDCLAEYAEVFPTVCVDAGYYRFPNEKSLRGLADQVPDGFRFSFKVTDQITVKKFTRLPRFGDRAGKPNENFLNPDLFRTAFLRPMEAVRAHVGVLIFEFSHFFPSDYARGREFTDALDPFLGALPKGWDYAVEIRNQSFLHPDYFACLSSHGVAHVFSSWERMPPVGEQLAMEGSLTNPACATARLLLRPGRRYEDAVASFSPYRQASEPYPDAREATVILIDRIRKLRQGRAFIYVNNRLEGNALQTIANILEKC